MLTSDRVVSGPTAAATFVSSMTTAISSIQDGWTRRPRSTATGSNSARSSIICRELLGRSNLAVVDAAVRKQRQLVLFLEKPEEDWADLRKQLYDRVPDYMVPKSVHYIEALPLNLNGKVDRPRLRDMAASQQG